MTESQIVAILKQQTSSLPDLTSKKTGGEDEAEIETSTIDRVGKRCCIEIIPIDIHCFSPK